LCYKRKTDFGGKKNMGKVVGYARVSTNEQNLNLQTDALKKEGCTKRNIYIDKASDAKNDRPGFEACLEALESENMRNAEYFTRDLLQISRYSGIKKSLTRLSVPIVFRPHLPTQFDGTALVI